MKKYIFLSLVLFLSFALAGEAQRRSTERSESKSKVEKSSSEKKQAARSTARPASRSSSAAKQAGRSSSSARPAARSSSSARPARSQSSSGNQAVKRESSRSNAAARPASGNNRPPASQGRSHASRSSAVSRPANTRQNQEGVSRSVTTRTTTRSSSGSAIQNRRDAGNRDRGTSARPVREYPASSNVERRTSTSNTVYHSSRKYVNRHPARHTYVVPPRSRDYRARYFPYRRPAHVHLHWSMDVFRFYVNLYPAMRTWTYYPSYRFDMVSAYDALFHIGELRTVYGRVKDVYYAYETDEFFLYFGAYYPYQDFTVVVPGEVAYRFSRNPDRYFDNDYVMVTGLITEFDGKPEIVVKHPDQIRRY